MNLVQHVIDTGMHQPFKQPLRRHPPAHLDVIDEHVFEMLRNDVIEPAASLWASNVVLARKANGQLRFCVDYRELNLQTYKDSYPLPRIETCLDSLGESKFFSSLNLWAGYWQAAIDPESADKTAFVTRRGTFRFKVLSFGLTNAPALFQRLMDLVLAGLTWEVCLVYLDDIIVMADTFEQHLGRLETVMRAGLKLNPAKCKLFQLKNHRTPRERKRNRTEPLEGAGRRGLANTEGLDRGQRFRGSGKLLSSVHQFFADIAVLSIF